MPTFIQDLKWRGEHYQRQHPKQPSPNTKQIKAGLSDAVRIGAARPAVDESWCCLIAMASTVCLMPSAIGPQNHVSS
jgi:hypothetical protein